MLQMSGTEGQGFPSWGRTQIRAPPTRCARPEVIGLKFALLSFGSCFSMLYCFPPLIHYGTGLFIHCTCILGNRNRDSQLSVCLESQKTFQILNSIGTVKARGTLLFYLLVF